MKIEIEISADTSGFKDALAEVKKELTETGQMANDVMRFRRPANIPDSLADVLEIHRENILYRRAHHDILTILCRKKMHPIVRYDVDDDILSFIFRELNKMFSEEKKEPESIQKANES
ncbi:MAG: hypothetical protein LBL79_07355 [Prevotella sp.]|jgi:hypothetical protein|nr:hypothetical protein [Prevotella sp.]